MSKPILPAKAFYLIRHGQTDANVAKIISGGCEATLTPDGHRQASQLGDALDQLSPRPCEIIHSGRTRTLATATYLNKKLHLPMVVNEGMDEHHFGGWMGLPTVPYVDRVILGGETPPDGESLAMFASRIQRVMTPLLEAETAPILFVAHNGTFRALLYLYGRPTISALNTTLYYFEPGGDEAFPWTVWKFHVEDGELIREKTDL